MKFPIFLSPSEETRVPFPIFNPSLNSPLYFPKPNKLHFTLIALKLAKVIPKDVFPYNVQNIRWTGGSTWIVQLGDQIDRCRPDSWKKNCIEDFSDVVDDVIKDYKNITHINFSKLLLNDNDIEYENNFKDDNIHLVNEIHGTLFIQGILDKLDIYLN